MHHILNKYIILNSYAGTTGRLQVLVYQNVLPMHSPFGGHNDANIGKTQNTALYTGRDILCLRERRCGCGGVTVRLG